MADPLSPKSPRKGKIINVRVHFLDDSVHAFQIPTKASGAVLWDQIIRHLQLMESDYFDVEYSDEHSVLGWVDRDKAVVKQLPSPDTPLRFRVKFYMPDPSLLEEEFTRYLFSLQIKHDLSLGLMTCSENTAALLASYIAQAEIGDFSMEDFVDHTYLSNLKFVPNQSASLEIKIMEYHRNHLGLSPSDADLNLLDTARKVEFYGILMYQARDHEAVQLTLAVAHMGVLVFQNHTKINTFSWAKIRKLSFKRKKFLIKLHPESYGYYRDTVEFFFESRNECKGFWKRCIEHHAFFRCLSVKKLARNKTRVVSRGSSFRYSGRTQKQLMEFVRENYTKHPGFERSVSGRISCRSTSVTPKIHPKSSTLNSADLRSHNSTASSGSHILDTSQDNHLCSTRVETAEVHSDSSMSGSRSLGSPKLETARSHDGLGRDGTEPEGSGDDLDVPDHERVPDLSPIKQVKSSPGPIFVKDRKMSAPALGYKDSQNSFDDLHLSRSPEVENIPESVEDIETSPTRTSLLRSFNSTPPVQNHKSAVTPPPTPPPPLIEDSGISLLSNQNKSTQSYDQSTVASSSVGIPSNISVLSSRTDDSEEDPKRKSKKYPVDRSYYIAKELLMTERTYKKDLEVLTVWFRNAVSKEDVMPEYLTHLLFSNLDPIYESHCNFLKEIEQRVLSWEGKPSAQVNGADPHHIGDIMLGSMAVLESYRHFLDRQEDILNELEQGCKRSRKFEQVYRDFEAQKVCYLPLNTFLLKPGQRLLHYKLILERLTKHYSRDHPDFKDAMAALTKLIAVIKDFKEKMKKLETLQKLMELQRDLVGIDNLVHPDREFIREGCLQKLSRKGYQQRMFFLFSDMMVYTSRTATSLLQFKVHGQLPLRGMMVEESDHAKMAVPNSFAIYGGNKCILVAASSEEEKDKWKEDMMDAIQRAKTRQDDKLKYASLKSSASSSENVDGNDEGDARLASPTTTDKHIQHRANTTMHVCWHRNTSVSMRDHDKARKNQLSGYLLRKFKNGTGWQKLWVVFTNFCLFFYKTYQDDFPLASLPLLGYAVTTPADEDGIHKDHVFKLQFKNHVYFFRAESEYTFSRWLEVINSATSSARRIRLFSRLESETVTAKN